VATPGRLGDLIERGSCDLGSVEITVLDEADQMADMGFLPEVTELMEQTPASGQRLLYSATLDADVNELVEQFLTDPISHSVDPPIAPVDAVDHHLLLVPARDKVAVTTAIAARHGRTMLFVKTQVGVDELVEQLGRAGVRAGALHGGKTQQVRSRVLAGFREGAFDALVATDVAARGLHVDGVSLVVHVDPPRDPKDYLHRAGRTARAGATGTVVTLVMPRQRKRTTALLSRSGVRPHEHRIRLGDPRLAEVTGARHPSRSSSMQAAAPARCRIRPGQVRTVWRTIRSAAQ
jgi:superfamily II DNA/RNA helicase